MMVKQLKGNNGKVFAFFYIFVLLSVRSRNASLKYNFIIIYMIPKTLIVYAAFTNKQQL